MRVALLTTFAASRKDPLGGVVERVHQAFLDSGLGEPSLWFLLADSWWVNGRNRAMAAMTIVEGDERSKKLPPHPPAVASVLAACGKVKKTAQVPYQLSDAGVEAAEPRQAVATVSPETARAAQEIVARCRGQMNEVVQRAALPHDLPATQDALRGGLATASGPRKPALEQIFKPMGYSIRGESGTFTLRRRTASKLTVQLSLDVGTWSNLVLAMFQLLPLGFKLTMTLPVTARATPMSQYPIGDAEQWRKIVENLGALVAELDRTLVPEVEAVVGPTPDWYQP